MPLKFNGTNIDKIIYNGVNLTKLIYNGTTVWEYSPYPVDPSLSLYPMYDGKCEYCIRNSDTSKTIDAEIYWYNYDESSSATDTFDNIAPRKLHEGYRTFGIGSTIAVEFTAFYNKQQFYNYAETFTLPMQRVLDNPTSVEGNFKYYDGGNKI